MRYEGLASQCILTPPHQDDALARSKMQQTDKKCQERHLLGYMGGRQKFEFYGLSRRGFQYWCLNSEKWTLLFYLPVKLWTITQAIVNSVGPSIAVSMRRNSAESECLTIWHLLDMYRTCPIYVDWVTYSEGTLKFFQIFNTLLGPILEHSRPVLQLWNKTVEK